MSEDALQILQENSFFNIREKSEQDPGLRIFFSKIAEALNKKSPDKILQGKFVVIGRTNANVPAHLLFILNDQVEEFFNLVRTIRAGGFSWEIQQSEFFISILIARVFLPWRSKVIIEIEDEKLLVFKGFIEEFFANSETTSVFSYKPGTSAGSKISNEINPGI